MKVIFCLVGIVFAFFANTASASQESRGPVLPAPAGSYYIGDNSGKGPVLPAPAGSYYVPDGYNTNGNGGKNHECNLNFNGKVVETTKTTDEHACKVWADKRAVENGWVSVTSTNNHICELMLNGKVVETTKTMDRDACRLWTEQRAKDNGWVRAE